jgi:cell division protein FtsX
VRAIDSASNEGAWSKPIAFQIEPSKILPVWAEWVLIFTGILLVIITVFVIRNAIKSTKDGKKT